MGSFRPNLEGMDLSSEVFSLIERLLDMINDKDKKLSVQQETIDGLRKQGGQLKKSVDEHTRKLDESYNQVDELKKKERQLTKNVEDKQKEIAGSRKQLAQLKSTQEQLQTAVDSLSATVQSTVLRKLVEEYTRSHKWSELRHRLKKVLDQKGKAHQQLCGVSKEHREPLKEVCAGGRLALLSLLLDAGLPTGHVVGESGGDTLLHAAVASGNLHSLELLLRRGADIAARNSGGETPLLRTAKEGHVALARSLLARGADLAACDAGHRTPLHWAAVGGHLDLAKLLVDAGADVKAMDGKEMTPLDCARSQGHDAVAEFLTSRCR